MRAVISGELTLRGRHQGILTGHGEGSGQAEWSASMVGPFHGVRYPHRGVCSCIRIAECAPVLSLIYM